MKSLPLTQALLNRYSKAAQDPNPIHLSVEAAKKVGLPGVIAHGMLSAAFLAQAVHEHFPNYQLKKISFRFKAMAFLNEELDLVLKNTKKLDTGQIEVELEALNSKKEVVTAALAQLSP